MGGVGQDPVKMEPSTEVPDPGAPPHSADLAIFQRDRAFSFEFFNFSGDDIIPAPAVHAASSELPDLATAPEPEEQPVTRRPRGDSIIFDPVSFQDGGIHEKNALLKVKAAAAAAAGPPPPPSNAAPVPTLLADSRLAAAAPPPPPPPAAVTAILPPAPLQATSAPVPMVAKVVSSQRQPTYNPAALLVTSNPEPVIPAPAPSSSLQPLQQPSHQVATLPSGLSSADIGAATSTGATTGSSGANGSTPATFQMDLLNKDGRIGIYLPEARRARIARFHAKRKMRIWRKRIKYDCRKKLADSRPRIKGRFVKRSDMEEE